MDRTSPSRTIRILPVCSTTKRRPLPSAGLAAKTGWSSPRTTVRRSILTEPGLPGVADTAGADADDGAVAVTAGASELAAEADGAADPVGLPVGEGEPQAPAASALSATRAAIRNEPAARVVRCIW